MSENRPLLVASDEAVREEVLRLAAAVDCEIEHAPDVVAAADAWATAPLVLIDESVLAADRPELTPRARIFLVCDGTPESDTWERAFTSGVQRVVTLPDEEGDLIASLADVVEGPGEEEGSVIAVIGARGGAGASVLATAVAAHGARDGGGALLVDCDPLGGGLDLVLGAEREDGLRWPGIRVNSGRVSMADLHAALPRVQDGDGHLSVLSCGRSGAGPTPDAVAAVVDAGKRAGQFVVCDLDRGLDHASRAAARRADLVLVVVPAEVRACAAATRVTERLGEYVEPASLRTVVRIPGPDGLGGDDIAGALGVPLLSVLRPERGLARALERGAFTPRTRGPLAATARDAAAEVLERRVQVGAR